MRSRSGCMTCRARKIKCDEKKPQCTQCLRGSRDCHPCGGNVFRHYQNPSVNEPANLRFRDRPRRLHPRRNALAVNSPELVAQNPPKSFGTTVHSRLDDNTDPSSNTVPNCEPLSPNTSRPVESSEHSVSPPQSVSGQNSHSEPNIEPLSATSLLAGIPSPKDCGFVDLLSFTPFMRGQSIPIATGDRGESLFPLSRPSVVNQVTDPETALLFRHFSEWPGQWMDLFDRDNHFSCRIPAMAGSNTLLRYAVCACAAKHFSKVPGEMPTVDEACPGRATMLNRPKTNNTDWHWIGAEYYEKAINSLMKHLPQDAQSGHIDDPVRPTTPHSDEILGATAILSVYELLDATDPACNRHLSGVLPLLDVFTLDGQTPPLSSQLTFSKGKKATFWNFARQDFLSAFINQCHTRLKTYNLTTWSKAGLHLDGEGCMYPNLLNGDQPTEEHLSDNLFFILSKIMNFIASGDDICPGYDNLEESGAFGISQRVLLEQWHHLRKELDAWYNSLPNTFQPCARTEPVSSVLASGEPSSIPFQEIWYAIPTCASTMQHYHMAKILLLINKPHESTARRTTVTTRLLSYRSIESEIRFHGLEICGISMSRPKASVRIHSVQPLFVSGQCLTKSSERNIILSLLRGIDIDLGWATDYRVKQLLAESGCDGLQCLPGHS